MFDTLVGNDALSAIVAFILVLIPAVIIHELGHFLAAKAVGITILEFGIGLPPRAVKLFSAGGTDYTLNWIPLGGFVRPLGEDMIRPMGDEAVSEDRKEAEARGLTKTMSVNEAKPLARIFFMAAGALANFLMALVLFTLIAMMGIPEVVGSRVNVLFIEPGSALEAAGLQPRDAIETIDGERYFGSPEVIAALAERAGQTVTLGVRRVDVADPIEIRVTLPETIGESVAYPVIVGVADNTPASAAGLQPLDLVIAFNGQPLAAYTELQQRTRENLGQEVTLTLLRGGQTIETSLVPRQNPPEGQGAMGIEIGQGAYNAGLGLSFQEGDPQQVVVTQPLDQAVGYAFNRMGGVIQTIASVPGQILAGTADEDDLRLTGPVGISQVGGFFLQESIRRNQPSIILEFVALISLVLGLTNLLPIPALDGGRILFVLIEIVRGRPIAPEREGLVHLIGMALLLSLMVLVVLNDIRNPITDLLQR